MSGQHPQPRFTLHLLPAERLATFEGGEPYTPEAFAADGFIHCTDGVANVVDVANRYYRDDPRDFVVFVIERDAITPPVLYEDPDRIYPHIYGALNADAIAAVLPVERAADGAFIGVDLPVELIGRSGL